MSTRSIRDRPKVALISSSLLFGGCTLRNVVGGKNNDRHHSVFDLKFKASWCDCVEPHFTARFYGVSSKKCVRSVCCGAGTPFVTSWGLF